MELTRVFRTMSVCMREHASHADNEHAHKRTQEYMGECIHAHAPQSKSAASGSQVLQLGKSVLMVTRYDLFQIPYENALTSSLWDNDALG